MDPLCLAVVPTAKAILLLLLAFGEYTEILGQHYANDERVVEWPTNTGLSSIDEPIVGFSFAERLRQLDEKFSSRVAEQTQQFNRRLDELENAVRNLQKVEILDWNVTDTGTLVKIFARKMGWDDAQNVCASFNAQLVTIDYEAKNNFVKGLIVNSIIPSMKTAQGQPASTAEEGTTTEFWMGLKTKTAMFAMPNSKYSNFYEDEKVDGCAAIDQEGKWRIRPCSAQKKFICQQTKQ